MSAEEYVEAVLSYVERIPPGRVTTYGAIADALAEVSGRNSARQVGTIMSRHGGPVPWHRVVTSAGRMPPGHEQEARQRLLSEGVPLKGEYVDMARASWTP